MAMGYKEAIEDGIEIIKVPYSTGANRRRTKFKVKCEKCNNDFWAGGYVRGKKYYCERCKVKMKRENEVNEDFEFHQLKEFKFETALCRIKNQVSNIDEYQNAIGIVHKTLHNIGWYQSTEEIMAAIEFLKNKEKVIHQQKILNYHVDFVLPDKKAIVEIDGKPYHGYNKEREGIRDGNIILAIGIQWELIRIDTDKINKNITKLLPAIDAILLERRKRRR